MSVLLTRQYAVIPSKTCKKCTIHAKNVHLTLFTMGEIFIIFSIFSDICYFFQIYEKQNWYFRKRYLHISYSEWCYFVILLSVHFLHVLYIFCMYQRVALLSAQICRDNSHIQSLTIKHRNTFFFLPAIYLLASQLSSQLASYSQTEKYYYNQGKKGSE